MKPLKVLLIDPGQLFWISPPSPISIPVKPGLLALFSYLRRHGVDEVSLLDLEREELCFPQNHQDLPAFEARCGELLAALDYDVAAISCFTTFSFQSTLMVARISKLVRPEAVVVVGGWHSLSEPEEFAEMANVFDFVVRGPGEKPLLDIAQHRLSPTPGQVQIVEASSFGRPELAEFEYLIRDYMRAAPEHYGPAFMAATAAMLPISRGCPYSCRFCGNCLHPHKTWMPLDVDRALALVDQARAAFPNLRSCYFGDAMFGAGRKWRREFQASYARDFPGLPYVVITRGDLLDEPDIELLAKGGGFVLLGVESLSVQMLQIMRKTPSPERYIEKTRQVVSALRAASVAHELFLILDHPGETEETQAATRSNLESLLDPGTTLVGFRYMPYPQFARAYPEFQSRFGTELQGPVRWWRRPEFFDAQTLSQRYVPSKKPGESFAEAKQRMGEVIAPLEQLCHRHARVRPHGEVVREAS